MTRRSSLIPANVSIRDQVWTRPSVRITGIIWRLVRDPVMCMSMYPGTSNVRREASGRVTVRCVATFKLDRSPSDSTMAVPERSGPGLMTWICTGDQVRFRSRELYPGLAFRKVGSSSAASAPPGRIGSTSARRARAAKCVGNPSGLCAFFNVMVKRGPTGCIHSWN